MLFATFILLWISHLAISYKEICSIVMSTDIQVERRLLGSGYHRDLETVVYVSSSENIQSCTFLVKEVLNPGAYVDPSQLKFMRELAGPDFYIPEEVNVETPAPASKKMMAYFFTRPHHTIGHRHVINLTIPIHLRYHRAKSGSYGLLQESVLFPHPSVYILCEQDYIDSCHSFTHLEPCPPFGDKKCDWISINAFSRSEWLEATVPVGDTDHTEAVIFVTTAVTCVSALFILTTLFRSKTTEPHNRSI